MRYRYVAKKKILTLFAIVVGVFILIAMKADPLHIADSERVYLPYVLTAQTMTRPHLPKSPVKTSVSTYTTTIQPATKGRQLHARTTVSRATIKPKVKIWTNPSENPDYFKPRETKVTPLDFKFLITSDICANGSTDLIIMVLSMASHRHYRDVIRGTWGSVNHNNTWAGTTLSQTVRLVFLFGFTSESETNNLKKEAAETNDIILADFKESYFNLTYKVLTGLKWINQYCSEAKYVMKNDEDSVVHIPWLLERLKSPQWNSKIIGPYFTNQTHFTSGKLGVSEKNYPFNIYPPHVKGNIYVMPKNMSLRILEVAEYMPYVNVEDVHITGILAKVIGATHIGISRQEYNPYQRPDLCDIAKRKKFAGRDVSASYAREIWKKILDPKSCI